VKLYMYDSFLVALINNKIFRGSLVMKNSSLPLKKKKNYFLSNLGQKSCWLLLTKVVIFQN
jgi:hypothetical protein